MPAKDAGNSSKIASVPELSPDLVLRETVDGFSGKSFLFFLFQLLYIFFQPLIEFAKPLSIYKALRIRLTKTVFPD
ncbi:MAG: hypothetical protein R3D26_13790 [Cyanobacteriota/Melainabacteria group bacterium]